MSYNKKFDLGITDIEMIEQGLRRILHERCMAQLQNPTRDEKLHKEITDIRAVLGKLHHQKIWWSSVHGHYT